MFAVRFHWRNGYLLREFLSPLSNLSVKMAMRFFETARGR